MNEKHFCKQIIKLAERFDIGLIIGAVFFTGSATAGGHESAEASPHEWSANMAVLSEYSFRGITQSNEDPAIQVGIDYAHASGFMSVYF